MNNKLFIFINMVGMAYPVDTKLFCYRSLDGSSLAILSIDDNANIHCIDHNHVCYSAVVISYKVFTAASLNPVNTLRDE
jgi:hypothetical protein